MSKGFSFHWGMCWGRKQYRQHIWILINFISFLMTLTSTRSGCYNSTDNIYPLALTLSVDYIGLVSYSFATNLDNAVMIVVKFVDSPKMEGFNNLKLTHKEHSVWSFESRSLRVVPNPPQWADSSLWLIIKMRTYRVLPCDWVVRITWMTFCSNFTAVHWPTHYRQ